MNDVVCFVLAPLVLDLTRRLDLPQRAYLIALATASNVGSVATLTGNPQNMLIGSFSGLSYRSFLVRQCSRRCGSRIAGSSRASCAPRRVESVFPCIIRS